MAEHQKSLKWPAMDCVLGSIGFKRPLSVCAIRPPMLAISQNLFKRCLVLKYLYIPLNTLKCPHMLSNGPLGDNNRLIIQSCAKYNLAAKGNLFVFGIVMLSFFWSAIPSLACLLPHKSKLTNDRYFKLRIVLQRDMPVLDTRDLRILNIN